MKGIIRIISIIVEIIIACAIFIMVAQKTPLFERAIPGRSDNTSWSNSLIPSDYNPDTKTIPTDTKNIATNTKTNSWIIIKIHNTIIDQIVYAGKSCTAPGWEMISDSNSIIAYYSPQATKSNECRSEIRTCKDGVLWWSYLYKICNYTIDGQIMQNNWILKDVTAWASESNQQTINLDNFIEKRNSIPRKYIQPEIYKNSSILIITEDISQKMSNGEINTNPSIMSDILDQSNREDDSSISWLSCATPWWWAIVHGSFVYAYNRLNSTITESCVLQKRPCIDGKLWWSFLYRSCNVPK
jgi:hypothetical protein